MENHSWNIVEDNLHKVKIAFPSGNLFVEAVSDSTIHIVFTKSEYVSAKKSKVIIRKDESAKLGKRETDAEYIFSTSKLVLHVNKFTGAFKWCDTKGRLLVKEPDKGGKFLIEKDVLLPEYDENAVIQEVSSADGMKSSISSGNLKFDRKAYEVKLLFEFGDEAIYGLGQHEEGILNYRNHSQYLYQQNMKLAVPMIVSTNHYGVLLDCMSFCAFHDNALQSYLWCECEDELDYYFIYGENFDKIIYQYRFISGDVPLFPKWAYGFIQSKERYCNQEELLSVVQEYRNRNIPIDCVVQDWMYWEDNKWGNKIFDATRYPSMENTVKQIHELNCKVMVSIWPNMSKGCENQQELFKAGAMLADQMVYNAYDEKAGDLYWKQAKEGIFDKDIDAWWCDSTEPYYADWGGFVEPELTERARLCRDEFKKFIDPEIINGYSLYHSDNIYRNQRKSSHKRVLNLTRSYFPGQQRLGTIVWSGDISARWIVFKNQIASALNVTVTGMPNWTYDIGAFFASDRAPWFWKGDYDKGVEDPAYREFFLRMFQTAVFLPMMRAHGTDTPREVWRFGEEGSLFYDVLVKWIRERYALLPHIYSLAARQTFYRDTMLRSLAFDFLKDKNVWNIADEFMFGRELLVCPVFESIYNAEEDSFNLKKERTVYLPCGCDWYTYGEDKLLKGGQSISVGISIKEIPIFVRAGSIILKQSAVSYSGQIPDYYEIHVYSGKNASLDWYEDAGDGYEYEKGEFVWIPVRWNESKKVLIINKAKGMFCDKIKEKNVKLIVHSNGRVVERTIIYRGVKTEIKF